MQNQTRIDYRRIEAAITYIAAHYRDAPPLDEVEAAANLSPFHFQRLFTRRAGVSPKGFARYLSLDHARMLLRDEGASCLDAAYEARLSGPGRLHDMFVRIEAMTPGECGRGGVELEIHHGFADSLFGEVIIAAIKRGVCHLAYCDDRAVALDRLRATPFQMKVWEALLRIPMGRLASYGDVAAAIGSPGAGRAVGAAIGTNPVAWLIPCHRVIRQSGETGGYM